jgi:hypothetical protein
MKDVFIYSLDSDSLSVLIDNVHMLYTVKWSFDDSYLCIANWWLDSLMQPRGETAITIFDVETKDTVAFIGDEGLGYRLGYLKGDTLVYLVYNFDNRRLLLYSYSLETKENNRLYDFKNLGVSDVIYSGENGIYFIGTVDDGTDYPPRDVYHLDLNNYEITQITTDGHDKDHLDIYLKDFKKID